MIWNNRPAETKSAPATDGDDLAELVDDAAKALSIGGPVESDGEMRRAVDRLKRLEAEQSEI